MTLGYIGRTNVRRSSLEVIGLNGMKRIAEAIRSSIDDDVKIRTADEKITPSEAADMNVREFSDDGGYSERNGVIKVTAFAVDHGVFIKPASGYRGLRWQVRPLSAIRGTTKT